MIWEKDNILKRKTIQKFLGSKTLQQLSKYFFRFIILKKKFVTSTTQISSLSTYFPCCFLLLFRSLPLHLDSNLLLFRSFLSSPKKKQQPPSTNRYLNLCTEVESKLNTIRSIFQRIKKSTPNECLTYSRVECMAFILPYNLNLSSYSL